MTCGHVQRVQHSVRCVAGSIQKRGPGSYRVRLYIGLDRRGKSRYWTEGFSASGDRAARRKGDELVAEYLAKQKLISAEAGTVAALIEHKNTTLDGMQRSGSTKRGERSIVNRILLDFGALRVEDVTPTMVDRWYATLATEQTSRGIRSPSTVHHYARVFRSLMRLAERLGWILKSPDRRASMPKKLRPEIHPPTTGAVRVLVAAADAKGINLGVAVRLAVATGARRGEILGLRWSDLSGRQLWIRRALVTSKDDDGHDVVIVGPPKGKKPRRLSLDSGVLETLAKHRERAEANARDVGVPLSPDGYIVAHSSDVTGQTFERPDWLSQAWAALCLANGAKGVRLHDLRHWHATELIESGMTAPTVSKRIGHAQISTTMDMYVKSRDEADELASDAIGELMA